MPLFVHILSIVRRITSFARPLHPRATLLFGCQARDITWLPVRRPDISPSPPLLFTRLLVFFNRNSRKRPGYIRPWAFSFSYPSLFLSVFFILRLQTFSTVDGFFSTRGGGAADFSISGYFLETIFLRPKQDAWHIPTAEICCLHFISSWFMGAVWKTDK